MRRTGRADFLSAAAGIDTGVNSVLAVSTSRDNSQGSGIAKGTKSTLAFAIKSSQFVSKVVLTSQASVRKTLRTENSKIKSHSNCFQILIIDVLLCILYDIWNRNLRFQLVVLWGGVISLGNSHESKENNDSLRNWKYFYVLEIQEIYSKL